MGVGQEGSPNRGLARSTIGREGMKSGQGAQAGPRESLGEKGPSKALEQRGKGGVGGTSLAYQRPMHSCEPYPAPSHGSKVSLFLSHIHSLSFSLPLTALLRSLPRAAPCTPSCLQTKCMLRR